jgi:UDP-GlcNAc3NAcA epimerase
MIVCSVVGARPQFIKAAVVNKVIEKTEGVKEIVIHTGQHYDENMSKVFFDELQIPKPDYNLEVGSASHAVQTAEIMIRCEKILNEIKPDWVLVYGDTNSTIAASLTAAKLHLKIAHVEAGLRSFNRLMPEEINRITTDRISNLLFAPTQNAVNLLAKEGITDNVVFTGDVMYDSILFYEKLAEQKYQLGDITKEEKFYLATIHRPANTDNKENLQNIFEAFSQLDFPVIVPLHPRTKSKLEGIRYSENVKIIEPVPYLKIILLMKNSVKILTDSGGLQKEAYFLNKQCVTLRTETEWIETLNNNWNRIADSDKNKIVSAVNSEPEGPKGNYFGDGAAGKKIVEALKNYE